jgi:mono/diheme cytochrome c family protein|tara:strand:+ start:134 stop:454 length:321 start_codon:yes stop_codon:yes gene_type:complete
MKKKLININCCIFLSIIFLSQAIKADDLFDQGKKIFLEKGNCATCHTLQDANSYGNIGPNLDEIKPDIMRIVSAVANGIGVMPPYEGELSNEEIKAVATYVAQSTN